eukprot:4393975-Amphidinium_carterae.3
MAGKAATQPLNSLAVLNAAGNGNPGNWNRRNQNSRDLFTTGQTQEGLCRHELELYGSRLLQLRIVANVKLNKTGGPSSKPGVPAQTPGAPAGKAGVPPTKTSPSSQFKLTEQLQRKHSKAAKDDPVMTEIVELALTKLTADKQQALPLKDRGRHREETDTHGRLGNRRLQNRVRVSYRLARLATLTLKSVDCRSGNPPDPLAQAPPKPNAW